MSLKLQKCYLNYKQKLDSLKLKETISCATLHFFFTVAPFFTLLEEVGIPLKCYIRTKEPQQFLNWIPIEMRV